MNNNLKRIMIISMLLAMAIVINYLESFIPIFIPGIRLGLANAIILIMLYEFTWYEALAVDILRILLVSLIRGTFLSPTFYMALSGGIISFIIMLLFSKIKVFSKIGVSILASLGHAFGQIIIAIILLESVDLIYYLPFIAVLSIGTGVLSGMVASLYLKRSITKIFVEDDKKPL